MSDFFIPAFLISLIVIGWLMFGPNWWVVLAGLFVIAIVCLVIFAIGERISRLLDRYWFGIKN